MPANEPCANPLLLEWVGKWVDEARERNSKGLTTYKKAYASLKACPVTFQHPSQLQQLQGFGQILCDRLTKKLEEHCAQNGLPKPKRPRRSIVPGLADQNDDEEDGGERPPKRQRKARPYVPTLRSGAYAIIMGLAELEEGSRTGITKTQLIEVAQPYCDASFTAPPDPKSYYTAWNSINTLVEKDLVCERRTKVKRTYSLTEEGWEVARRIQQTRNINPNPPSGPVLPRTVPLRSEPLGVEEVEENHHVDRALSLEVETQPGQVSNYSNVVANGDSSSGNAVLPSNFRPIRLTPGSFEVQLVLDVREVRSRTDRDYMQNELAKKGVSPIMRSLDLGDALWVAKCKDANFLSRCGAEGDEVVLDYVVERKRLDDLISSVKDGRFHEQKFRLKRSGIKNIIYIVEEVSMDGDVLDRRAEMVQSAIGSTQVVNGFFVKKTQKMDDTIRYLTRMTMLLKKQYESKSILVIPTEVLTAQNYLPLLEHLREKNPSAGHYISYPAFASLASKSEMMTLRDLYLKMLMCTKQVSGEKALEIQKRWKTPYEFVKAYEDCGNGEEGKKRKREMVFQQMGNLMGRKKITKPLSLKIAEIWADDIWIL
ncbi:crossover junction endonuclease MUS81 [Hypomontagnella submonticulosa]|nr:crossover junction endonuclease MUS81 [Hypomontagnella submonticulosa]